MRVDLDIAQHQLTWPELHDRARFAEETGFSGGWLFDHFVALYGNPAGPCMESWTLLAALAATTETLRLGTLVTGVTYRNPAMLAMEAVTVDQVSAGRLDFAIGAAWHEGEHRMLGFEFPPTRERMDRLAEALDVIEALWTRDGATYHGRFYRLDDATYRPRPAQQPHPPIWIGGGGETRTLPLAARHADVWHCFGTVETLSHKSALLDRFAVEAGRDPASITRATSISIDNGWDDIRAEAFALREAGFEILIAGWPSQGRDRVEEFGERILPELAEV